MRTRISFIYRIFTVLLSATQQEQAFSASFQESWKVPHICCCDTVTREHASKHTLTHTNKQHTSKLRHLCETGCLWNPNTQKLTHRLLVCRMLKIQQWVRHNMIMRYNSFLPGQILSSVSLQSCIRPLIN